MTVEEIERRVEAIRDSAGDDEVAHGMEDRLRHDVLEAIANRKCDDPAECAGAVLRTTDIDFQRWCA